MNNDIIVIVLEIFVVIFCLWVIYYIGKPRETEREETETKTETKTEIDHRSEEIKKVEHELLISTIGLLNKAFDMRKEKRLKEIETKLKIMAKDRFNEKIETYHNNGNIKMRFYTDENGKLHGLHQIWDCDGTIRMRRNYKNGKLHGIFKIWEERELQSTWYYINGKEVEKKVWNEFEKK